MNETPVSAPQLRRVEAADGAPAGTASLHGSAGTASLHGSAGTASLHGSAGTASSHGSAGTAVWHDWITIWQSELAALAVDREVHEAMQRAVDLWADGARAVAAHDPAGRPGAPPPARPPPPVAASDRSADAPAEPDLADSAGAPART